MDDPLAREHLEQAQLNGDALSIMWLARVYSTGRMTYPADKSRAREIANSIITAVEARAESGEAEAEFLIGTALAEGLGNRLIPSRQWPGIGVPPSRGTSWPSTIWATSVSPATAYHKAMSGRCTSGGPWPPNRVMPFRSFRLGQMYEQGRGVEQDLEQAIAWYQDLRRAWQQ